MCILNINENKCKKIIINILILTSKIGLINYIFEQLKETFPIKVLVKFKFFISRNNINSGCSEKAADVVSARELSLIQFVFN